MSLSQYYYAKALLKMGLVFRLMRTERLKMYMVKNTKGDGYEVMVNEKGYSCTCEYSSLWSGGVKDCCHIKAVKMLDGDYER